MTTRTRDTFTRPCLHCHRPIRLTDKPRVAAIRNVVTPQGRQLRIDLVHRHHRRVEVAVNWLVLLVTLAFLALILRVAVAMAGGR